MTGERHHGDRARERGGERRDDRFLPGKVEAGLHEVEAALVLEVVAEAGDQETAAQRGGPIRAEFEDGRGRGMRREGRRPAAVARVRSEVLERPGKLQVLGGVGRVRVGFGGPVPELVGKP